jgi:LEA14-like dessication related protein
MRRNRLPIFAVLALALALGGCASRLYRQPEVTLKSVELGGLGLRGGTLLVNLDIVNPNGFALNADRLDYSLVIADAGAGADSTAWIDFATGSYDRAFSVAARDSATVQIPVEFSYTGLGRAGARLLNTGTFDFRARGSVDVRTPVGRYAVPFQKRGTVSLTGVR